MNRERRVTDLFYSVQNINDRDAFQLLIGNVSDDYVLADLRNRFWDGTGEKPWQVIEINRQLTRRKETRQAAGLGQGSETTPSKPLSFKERIENNLIVFFLATLLAGFLSGVGAYEGALKIVAYEPVSRDLINSKNEKIASLEERLSKAEANSRSQHWLRIMGVEGLDGSRARLIAHVNGRAYSYPSRAVWSRLGPGMSEEDFALPIDTDGYDISFELLTLASNNEYRQFQSQLVVPVKSYPFDSDYKIFAVTIEREGPVRGATSQVSVGSVRGVPTKERSGEARIKFRVY